MDGKVPRLPSAIRIEKAFSPFSDFLNDLAYNGSMRPQGMGEANVIQRFVLFNSPPNGKKKSPGKISWPSVLVYICHTPYARNFEDFTQFLCIYI
jgi:hypothetical protein